MNGKLIGLLIRSNAVIVEALDESARLADKDGTYDSDKFWNLRQEIVAMAEQAEAMADEVMADEVTIAQQVKIAVEQGAREGFNKVRESFPPMVPISPAHEVKHQSEPLRIQYADIGKVYLGKSSSTGQQFTARIEDLRAGSTVNADIGMIRTSMLTLADKHLTPFDRFISEPDFIKEFIRWVE